MTRSAALRAKAGFALPSVLFVVAMVTLVFLVAIQALTSLADETRLVRNGVRFEAQALSLEAQTTFDAATRPLGPSALLSDNGPSPQLVLALDGRSYIAGGGALVLRVQDEAGLINLDNMSTAERPRLFDVMGVPPAWQPTLADRLGDYLDVGDLKRPLGADSADYLRAGLPAPPDGPLTRRAQLLGVLGWHEAVPTPLWRRFADNVTADPTSTDVNVNTATPVTLQVLYGLSPAQAAAAVARRQGAPFTELEDLGRATGLKLVSDAERVYTMPNGRFQVRIEDPATGFADRARLLLSPDDASRPFWVVERAISQPPLAERTPFPAHAQPFADPAD